MFNCNTHSCCVCIKGVFCPPFNKIKKRLLDQIDKKKLKLKDLLMTKDQLIENNYPMDYNEDGSLNESTKDFVKTVDLTPEAGEDVVLLYL